MRVAKFEVAVEGRSFPFLRGIGKFSEIPRFEEGDGWDGVGAFPNRDLATAAARLTANILRVLVRVSQVLYYLMKGIK